MKKRKQDLTDKERVQTLDALYTATSTLTSRNEMKAFLRDLLTESERIMLGRRILIAQSLLRGESARNITEEMRVGIDTIYRVERWLADAYPGYETAVTRLEQEIKKRQGQKPGSFAHLKKKYPLHFLLFNIYDDLVAKKGLRKTYRK